MERSRRLAAAGAALLILGACSGASGQVAAGDGRSTVAATLLSSSPLPVAVAAPSVPPPTGATPATGSAPTIAPPTTSPRPPRSTSGAPASTGLAPPRPTSGPAAVPGPAAGTSVAPTPAPVATSGGPAPTVGLHTACAQVAHIGDSTSEHLWDPSTVGGDPDAPLDARYRAVGVVDVINETSGGRSMIERIDGGQRNAVEVAERIRASGYRGCWVLMIGTNDAANVAAGATTGLAERIERLLDVIDGDPVLWVNASSASTIPFYGADSMLAFDAVLDQVAAAHPNVRVLDWASIVRPDWYGPDGLHYGSVGRAWRAALTAQELALAFPGPPG